MTTSAETVAHSRNPNGSEILTFATVFPHIILPQLNKHRAFSNSAQSSRAVPIWKLIASVLKSPYVPKVFLTNVGGMSGGEPFRFQRLARAIWFTAMYACIAMAWLLDKLNISKEIANRLLEPFSYVAVVITSTEWDNFYNLRISEHAQDEIRDLAVMMKAAHLESEPVELAWGEWHSPYDPDQRSSAAFCARQSYQTRQGQSWDKAKNHALADRLQDDRHWTPFEHQARAQEDGDGRNLGPGWMQYRAILDVVTP